MKARAAILALLFVLAACGSSAANSSVSSSGAAGGGHGSCGSPSAKTLAANGRVRVYPLHGIVYGCSVARGRSFRLGHATRSIAELTVGPVAVAGDLAAYGVWDFGVDTVRSTVVVRRLTDGKALKELSATRAVGAESFQSVGSVVVRASGAVAWIGAQRSIIGGRRAVTEVHAADAGGDRVLDSGQRIDAASLRLHGSTLTWVDGGATRHGTLR